MAEGFGMIVATEEEAVAEARSMNNLSRLIIKGLDV